MGKVESVSKKFKIFRFFWQLAEKNLAKKLSLHAAQLDGVPSIGAKTLAFPSLL